MSTISPMKECADCRQIKRVVSEQLFANGLYGFYCVDCDKN